MQKHVIQIVYGCLHYRSLFGSQYITCVQHVKYLCWVGSCAIFLEVFGQVLPHAWPYSADVTLDHKIIIVSEDSRGRIL